MNPAPQIWDLSGHLTSAPRVVPLETGVAEGGETQSGNREAWSAPAASSSSAAESMPDLCSAQGLKFEQEMSD